MCILLHFSNLKKFLAIICSDIPSVVFFFLLFAELHVQCVRLFDNFLWLLDDPFPPTHFSLFFIMDISIDLSQSSLILFLGEYVSDTMVFISSFSIQLYFIVALSLLKFPVCLYFRLLYKSLCDTSSQTSSSFQNLFITLSLNNEFAFLFLLLRCHMIND